MAIATQCPMCRRKQSNRNKKCKECGESLDKAKKSGRVRYWINYRINGKLRWEYVGTSIDEAKAAEGKRRAQKKENRILEILVNSKITWSDLSKWYLEIDSVRSLATFSDIETTLRIFNETCNNDGSVKYGNKRVIDTKQVDVEGL